MDCESKDPFGLKPVWNAILDVYQEFARICNKNCLTYYCSCGTVLGAIRHNGFIPWDDDFDVMMPRGDYDRFIEIVEHELRPDLRLVTWHNTPSYVPKLFAKIQNCDKSIVDNVEKEMGSELKQGIYIDIFPLDGWPKSKTRAFMLRMYMMLLTIMGSSFSGIFEKRRGKTIIARLVGWVARFACLGFATRERIMRHLEDACKTFRFNESELVGVVQDGNIGGQVFCASCLGKARMQRFEDVQVPIPSNADVYLKAIYGDYMRLPPEEQRKPTHGSGPVAEWKFGPQDQ